MTDTPAFLLLGLRAALAISLYAFLALGFILLWQDLRRSAENQVHRRIPPITLMLQSPSTLAQEHTFSFQTVLIGREPSCELQIENDTVSGQHARLDYRLGQWWLEDLHSRNGTTLNELPVEVPIVVTNQDVIRCGEAQLHVRLEIAIPGISGESA